MSDTLDGEDDARMRPGDKVRLRANPGRIGILGNETDGPASRKRVLVNFLDGDEQFVLEASLEKVEKETPGPYALIARGLYGRVGELPKPIATGTQKQRADDDRFISKDHV